MSLHEPFKRLGKVGLRAKPKSTVEYFDRTAERFAAQYEDDPAFHERRTIWRRAIEKVSPHIPMDTLCLDLGCGDGSISRFLAAQGRPVVGLDQSEAMLALARCRAGVEGLSRTTVYRRASLPLDHDLEAQYQGKVGLILCSSVLEYVSAPRVVLEQCHRLLAPGGVLLVSLPNRESLYRIGQRVFGSALAQHDSYLQHQLHQYRAADAVALLVDLGYRVSDAIFFALPFHRYTGRVVPRYRGRWLATMMLFAAHQSQAAASDGFRGEQSW